MSKGGSILMSVKDNNMFLWKNLSHSSDKTTLRDIELHIFLCVMHMILCKRYNSLKILLELYKSS